MTSTEFYWSTLKMFLNNRKLSCIPVSNASMSHILKKKTEILYSFFAKKYPTPSFKCSLINNSSKLSSKFVKSTKKVILSKLPSIHGIKKIIRDLDPNKVNGNDKISTRMAKILRWVHVNNFRDNFRILHRKRSVSWERKKKQI